MQYQWAAGAHGPIDAQIAGDCLESIRQRDHRLTPAVVVDEARPTEAALHPAFEWNDQIAAEHYREDQARYLIRSVVQINEDRPTAPPVRAFVTVKQADETVYTSTYIAMADPDMRKQLLSRALAELNQWRRRYHELQELADIFQAAEHVQYGKAA